MTARFRFLLTAMATTAILAAAIGTASAGRLSTSNQNIRITWREVVWGGGIEDVCDLTLEGSFHSRTITKTPGALLGYITRSSVNRCSITTTTGLNLPWHIRYTSFSGTLPNITSLRVSVIDTSFLLSAVGGLVSCLFRSSAARPWLFELLLTAGVATGARLDETAQIPLAEDLNRSGLCPEALTFAGTGSVTLLGATTRITIRLI